MISIEQINGEIAVLEEQIPTHVTMQKLASLYIVRDHMGIAPADSAVPAVSVVQMETMPEYGMSEFLQAVAGKSVRDVMLKMDELMSTLMVVNPRLYESVMRDLTSE